MKKLGCWVRLKIDLYDEGRVKRVKKEMRPLDMKKVKSKPSKTMSSKEALSDVKKINWSSDVKNGTRKVRIKKACAK